MVPSDYEEGEGPGFSPLPSATFPRCHTQQEGVSGQSLCEQDGGSTDDEESLLGDGTDERMIRCHKAKAARAHLSDTEGELNACSSDNADPSNARLVDPLLAQAAHTMLTCEMTKSKVGEIAGKLFSKEMSAEEVHSKMKALLVCGVPRELARKLVSCRHGGVELFTKSGRRRKAAEIVPSAAKLKAIRKAKAKESDAVRNITHGIVYKLTSPSGKSYVGISKHSISKRLLWHVSKDSRCRAIHSALKKYGTKNFKKEILHKNVALEDLPRLEQMEIARHETMTPKGYNLTQGGEYNPMDEPASRKKVSDAKTTFWKSKTAGEKASILKHTQEPEVRARATETKLKRGLERAQKKAEAMHPIEAAKYMKRFLEARERRQKEYLSAKSSK